MTMIVIAGIPGSGKSSTAKELSIELDATVFLEPEEDQWPDVAKYREVYGFFTGITWFRSFKTKQLLDAEKISKQNKIVVLDTYYDKLIYLCLGKKGVDWLIPSDDVYFSATKEMARVDYKNLPNADIVVGLRISEDVWKNFVSKRDRITDQIETFQRECFAMQEVLLEAAQQYCIDFNKQYIEINQESGKPNETALMIKNELIKKQLIPRDYSRKIG